MTAQACLRSRFEPAPGILPSATNLPRYDELNSEVADIFADGARFFKGPAVFAAAEARDTTVRTNIALRANWSVRFLWLVIIWHPNSSCSLAERKLGLRPVAETQEYIIRGIIVPSARCMQKGIYRRRELHIACHDLADAKTEDGSTYHYLTLYHLAKRRPDPLGACGKHGNVTPCYGRDNCFAPAVASFPVAMPLK